MKKFELTTETETVLWHTLHRIKALISFGDVTHWMPLPAPPDRRPPEGEEDGEFCTLCDSDYCNFEWRGMRADGARD